MGRGGSGPPTWESPAPSRLVPSGPMTSLHAVSSRGRWIRATAAGVAIVLAGMGWSTGAGAARDASGKLPVIGNATNLEREPIVHATKGKPPKKLEVKNLVVGTGAIVKKSDTVSVLYVGANYKTGKDFTQGTWEEKAPVTFGLDDVVKGFAEGLIGMRVGGRREIVIPPALGYDDEGTGPIKPDETLVFVVDLKGVRQRATGRS